MAYCGLAYLVGLVVAVILLTVLEHDLDSGTETMLAIFWPITLAWAVFITVLIATRTFHLHPEE